MKKLFLGVFIAVILFFSVWGIIYVSTPANSVDAVQETIENTVTDTNAVIIKDEEIYYSSISGTLYNNASEGERVAKNALISTVFSGSISDENLKTLRTLDKKIAHRRAKLREPSIYQSDGIDVESKIENIIEDIAPSGRENNVTRISDYKEDLNNLRKGVEISDEEMLESLLLEKDAIENRISTSKEEIVTNMAGIFTTYIDGLEEALSPENIPNYTVSGIHSLGNAESRKLADDTVESGGAVCKVVNNHVWYTAMAVPSDKISSYSVGDKITLRFNSVADAEVDGTIYHISETEEDGLRLVAVKCQTYFEGAISYRNVSVDMIFESYTGYKLPVHAIRTADDGRKYVLGMIGSKEYVCYCDILYTDAENEYIIIESTENAENKLRSMERIVVGEK